MRKFLALLLTVSLLAAAFSGCKHLEKPPVNDEPKIHTTGEQDQSTEPNPSSDFEYQTNASQTGILINKYIGSSEYVMIPSHINDLPVLSLKGVPDAQHPTAIAKGAFEGSFIQAVTIPETVRVIGYQCFKDCQNLRSVTVAPDSSLMNINGRSFENCAKLEEIDVSSTQVTEIGSLAFHGCANLKTVAFSNTLESIQEKAFYECRSLLEVDFPESLTDIQGGAFAYCASLRTIALPAGLSLTSLNEPIFHNVPILKQIVFKEGRESITGYALIQTDANVNVIVPSGVKTVSPLPFFFHPPAQIILTFLGDAPAIVEDKDVSWLNAAIVRYPPEAAGWEAFAWKDRCEMQPLQN